MVQDRRHRSFLLFMRRLVDIPAAYSFDDLLEFRDAAKRYDPSLLKVIDAYLELAYRSRTRVTTKARRPKAGEQSEMHLFDLLRDKRLFPSNNDLSEFAGRVLPTMNRNRFDKMSRADIAARIIEYVETRDEQTRQALVSSMREAVTASPPRATERRSFFSKWERIIKGLEI